MAKQPALPEDIIGVASATPSINPLFDTSFDLNKFGSELEQELVQEKINAQKAATRKTNKVSAPQPLTVPEPELPKQEPEKPAKVTKKVFFGLIEWSPPQRKGFHNSPSPTVEAQPKAPASSLFTDEQRQHLINAKNIMAQLRDKKGLTAEQVAPLWKKASDEITKSGLWLDRTDTFESGKFKYQGLAKDVIKDLDKISKVTNQKDLETVHSKLLAHMIEGEIHTVAYTREGGDRALKKPAKQDPRLAELQEAKDALTKIAKGNTKNVAEEWRTAAKALYDADIKVLVKGKDTHKTPGFNNQQQAEKVAKEIDDVVKALKKNGVDSKIVKNLTEQLGRDMFQGVVNNQASERSARR